MMQQWMSSKGYSVKLAKQQVRLLQAEAREQSATPTRRETGMTFIPMEPPQEPDSTENFLYGVNLTFPNGTIATIKKGSAKSVMQLMKLYEKEDVLCSD